VHSNGLTLARRVLQRNEVDLDEKFPKLGDTIGMELLTPTEIYVRKVMEIVSGCTVHGMIDVTGGGLRNFLRLRHGVGIQIDEPMPVPPIFRVLGDLGSVEPAEMYQTFNMGLGFALVCPPEDAVRAASIYGEGARVIGRIVEGSGVTVPSLGLRYERY